MAKHDKYHPDYSKLYPGIESRPEILAVLKQSDRKMKYIEVDLKTERPVYSKKAGRIIFRPSREDSFERLCEDVHIQFASDDSSLEEELAHKDMLQRLRNAMGKLEHDEASLIHALFYEGLSERQLSKRTGIPQRTIHDRKRRILVKLHKLMEN